MAKSFNFNFKIFLESHSCSSYDLFRSTSSLFQTIAWLTQKRVLLLADLQFYMLLHLKELILPYHFAFRCCKCYCLLNRIEFIPSFKPDITLQPISMEARKVIATACIVLNDFHLNQTCFWPEMF